MSKHWGPQLWYLIHTITYNYSKNPGEYEKFAYYKFFHYYVPELILCSICRNHYIKFLKNISLKTHLDKRCDLIIYFISLHNTVNKRLRKKIFTRDEVNVIYKNKVDVDKILKYLEGIYMVNHFKFLEFIKLLILVLPDRQFSKKLISLNIFSFIDNLKIISKEETRLSILKFIKNAHKSK